MTNERKHRSLRELVELDTDGVHVKLGMEIVKVRPVGRPVVVCSRAPVTEAFHGDDFVETFDQDKKNYIPYKADSFMRGSREQFDERKDKVYMVPVQFYKISN